MLAFPWNKFLKITGGENQSVTPPTEDAIQFKESTDYLQFKESGEYLQFKEQ